MAMLTTADVKLSALPPATGRAGLRGVLASEFTKLRSVRSTYFTIAALMILSVGISALIGFGQASNIHNNPWNKAGTDATQLSLGFFFYIGQLIIAVIGAMIITSEYSTGMIRTSLTAMPRRGTVYLGKLIVLTVVTLVVSLVTSFLSFFVGQAALSGSGVSASLFHSTTIPANVNMSPPPNGNGPPNYTFIGTDVIHASTVLQAIVGTALFVTLVALIAFGLGAIIRHTAAAITVVVAVVCAGGPLNLAIRPYLPIYIVSHSLSATTPLCRPGAASCWLSAWSGLGMLAIYAATAMVLGALILAWRDA